MFVFLASISLMREKTIYLELCWSQSISVYLFRGKAEHRWKNNAENLKPLHRERHLWERFVWPVHCFSDMKSENSTKHFWVPHTLEKSLGLSVFSFLYQVSYCHRISRYFRFEVGFYTSKTKKYTRNLSMLTLKSSSSISVCPQNETF